MKNIIGSLVLEVCNGGNRFNTVYGLLLVTDHILKQAFEED